MPSTNRYSVLSLKVTAKDHPYQHRIIKFLRGFSGMSLTGLVLCLNAAMAEPVSDNNLPPASAPILHSVIDEARASAQTSYEANDHQLARELKEMSYETYRDIQFDSEASLWRDQNNYEVQFFHPGFLYQQPVTVYTVGADNQPERLPFSRQSFKYTGTAAPLAKATKETDGYAGFRVHYPIKNTQFKDEFAVFLGASYFRLVGKEHVYGLSARGLAIDTGMPEGEEFPHFTSFWLIEPDEDEAIIIYARLESPSVSAAYKFTITPDTQTSVQVESWLFAREDVNKLGIAPFTSMFLYGENTLTKPDDYRPEVHDSDGMTLLTGSGEQIWRVLTNPAHLQITSLSDDAPAGFGMLQRDTSFASYMDGEANYHQRPGLWVTPKAGFGEGRLELVEIPTQSETHDNIVAYWVPSEPLKAGDSRYFAYQLDTVTGARNSNLATVVRTRQGAAVLPGEKNSQVQSRRFAVDFTLPENLSIDADALNLTVETSHGQIQHARVYPVDNGTLLRATFLLTPQKAQPADMRAFIKQDNQLISEVWNYVYHAK